MSGASRKDSGERLTKKQRKAEAFRRGDRKRKRPEPSALPEMDVDESETSAAPLVKKGEKVEDKTEVKPKEGKRKEKSKAQPRFIVFAGKLFLHFFFIHGYDCAYQARLPPPPSSPRESSV